VSSASRVQASPTVYITLGDLIVEVKDDHVHFGIAKDGIEFLSWEEWRDCARRIAHAIQWVEEHAPDDADGRSYEADSDE
jgi:hypothetical protein